MTSSCWNLERHKNQSSFPHRCLRTILHVFLNALLADLSDVLVTVVVDVGNKVSAEDPLVSGEGADGDGGEGDPLAGFNVDVLHNLESRISIPFKH